MAAAASIAMTAVPASAAPALTIHGTMAGHYRLEQTIPDTGTGYTVVGHGRVGYGAMHVRGWVHGPGNVPSGRCYARLVLRNDDGRMVIYIRGTRTVRGFDSCQSGFAFVWHSGKTTGAYAGRDGSGRGTLTLVKRSRASSSPPPFYVTFDRP